MVLLDGFEPSFLPYHGSVLPLHTMGAKFATINIFMENSYYITKLETNNMFDPTWKFIPKRHPLDLQINVMPFTDYFIKYLESFNLLINSTLVFYTTISHNFAHVDLKGNMERANPALNYIISGKRSVMNWYSNPKIKPEVRITPSGTLLNHFALEDLELIDSYEVTKNELALVRVDIPHSIQIRDEPRICISIRLEPTKHREWKTVVDEFESKGLLIPR